MLLRVCLTSEKPTAFIAITIIIVIGKFNKICLMVCKWNATESHIMHVLSGIYTLTVWLGHE